MVGSSSGNFPMILAGGRPVDLSSIPFPVNLIGLMKVAILLLQQLGLASGRI